MTYRPNYDSEHLQAALLIHNVSFVITSYDRMLLFRSTNTYNLTCSLTHRKYFTNFLDRFTHFSKWDELLSNIASCAPKLQSRKRLFSCAQMLQKC